MTSPASGRAGGATPRPWQFNDISRPQCWLEGANGQTVWHIDDYGNSVPSEVDAELIVRAVNAHDELVEVLTDLLAENEELAQASHGPGDDWREEWKREEPEHFAICERACAALRRANGESHE